MIRRRILISTLLVASFPLASCGGGDSGGGGGTPPVMTAPSDLHYPTPPAFVVNTAIAALTPTVDGQVAGYSISPSLPAGLSLNTATGVIAGTPTNIAGKTSYTVKATNAGGSTTAIVSILVNGVAPSIAYSAYYGFTANVSAQPITPTVSGGAVVSWTIKPGLPAGLASQHHRWNPQRDAHRGVGGEHIYGHCDQFGRSVGRGHDARNRGGAALIDLGHSSTVELSRYANSSLISLDEAGHWVLQAYGSGAILASGEGACVNCTPVTAWFVYPPVDIAGPTAIDNTPSGIEIRSAASGQLLATIPGQFSWFKLASDGSYIATGSTAALSAWSTSGQPLLSLAGDYSKAVVFSAPGQVQVALGPVGANVIQTVSVPGGSASVSPAFQGAFNTWFVDGTGFLTSLGNTIWTYSSAVVQMNITPVSSLGSLGGEGNYFWNYNNSINIYQVGGGISPVFTASSVNAEYFIPSGTTIGVVYGEEYTLNTNQLAVIDLSGAMPVSTSYTVPIADLSAYAAVSAGLWVVGNEQGVIFDGASLAGQPRYLTLGQVSSIAAGTGYFSVATASGQIFYFNASTDAMVGTINFLSSQISMSSDGTVLAASSISPDIQNQPNSTVNLYSLPSANLDQ